MSIQAEIERLQGTKADIKLAIENKGVSVPSSEKIDNYDTYINQIQGKLQEKTVTPDAIGQTVLPDTNYDGLSQVVVNGDANLLPSNVLKDVTIFGTTGTVEPYVAPNLQSKTATPSASSQTVVADTGYDGLSSVAIDGDFNLISGNIRKDVSIFGVTGTLDPQVAPNLQSKSVTPSANSQTVTPDTGYDGLSSVNVSGDGNLISSNIKKDVSIFGVTGNYEGSGGGGSSELNVYVQNSEPTSKKGVWIKGSSSGDTYLAAYYTKKGEFITPNNSTNLNTSDNILGQVVVNNYLYSFEMTSGKLYDLRNNTFLNTINVPSVGALGGSGFGVGAIYVAELNKIYVFYLKVGINYELYYYIYDIESNTYTSPVLIRQFGSGSIYDMSSPYKYGNDIYIFVSGAYVTKRMVVFNISSNSISQELSFNGNCYLSFSYGVGNKIYGISNNSSPNIIYEYSIDTNTARTIANIPSGYLWQDYRGLFAYGDKIYIFYKKSVEKYLVYSLTTNTFEEITPNIPYDLASGDRQNLFYDEVNGRLFLRSKAVPTYMYQFDDSVHSESIDNGDVVVIQDLGYRNPVDIIDNPNIQIGVYDTFIKKNDSLDGNHASFWGDGEKWNLIKNPVGDTVTVSFDTAGGSGTFPSQQVIIGQTATEPQGAPTKTGDYVFDSWYLGNEPYDWNYKPVSDITLTAHYAEYEEVEYIQSTGTQYIDTEIVPSLNISLEAEYLPIGTNRNYLFGSYTSNGRFQYSHASVIFVGYGNGYQDNISFTSANTYTIQLESNNFKLNSNQIYSGSSATFTSNPNNILLFGINSDGTTTAGGLYRVYSFKIYDNGTLVRDFQPIKLSTGEYCLLDKVNSKVYHNAGSGAFIGEGYEPTYLEYIESTGTQYIDTGVLPYKTKCEIRFQTSYVPPITGYMIACWNPNDNRYYPLAYQANTNSYVTANRSNSYTTLGAYDNNIHTMVYNDSSNKVYFDGVEKETVSDLTTQGSYSIFLFANHTSSGNADGLVSCKMYSAKIIDKDTNTVLRDFAPALDYSGIPCLWDKVTETFYYNAGTGTFNYGELT